MKSLTEKKCVPCERDAAPLVGKELLEYSSQLKKSWEVVDGKKIRFRFQFKDFKEAMKFVNNVAGIAEQEQHHPDIKIVYNKVTIELWTHTIGGLSENDFILAAKVEELNTVTL